MSSSVFNAFIRNVERFGLPTRFLREVSTSSYTVLSNDSSSYVNTWLNLLFLDVGDIVSANHAAGLDIRAATGVLNIYHEATHAWLDLNEKRTDVAALQRDGTAHYQRAPLDRGVADDPNRVFQEAMGEYVGHRELRRIGLPGRS